MVANSGRESALEQALRSELFRRGLRFRKHLRILPGLRCQPDIVFTKPMVAVFIDGCFWHRCPEHATDPRANGTWWRSKLADNVTRDRRNDEALRSAGWTVLRFWEHEPISGIADEISAVLTAMGTTTR
jgi:DNA mismatch endonuclease (patch repair protein)